MDGYLLQILMTVKISPRDIELLRDGTVFDFTLTTSSNLRFTAVRNLKGDRFQLSDFCPTIESARSTRNLANGGQTYTKKDVLRWSSLLKIHHLGLEALEVPEGIEYIQL